MKTGTAIYPAIVDRALIDTATTIQQNSALLVTPEANADVDADRMLVQSRLAQYRKVVESAGLDLDEMMQALAGRAIQGMSIDQGTAVSNLESLMPEKTASVRAPYSAQISRETPAMFLVGLDLSKSITDPIDAPPESGKGTPKIRSVENVLNEILFQLAIKSGEELPNGDYIVKDYFHMLLMGYGNNSVRSVLPKDTANEHGFAPLSALVANPSSERDGKPVFFEGFEGAGNTPMKEFFEAALGPMQSWSDRNAKNFPPILINISDGEWTGDSPIRAAERIRQVKGEDGNALVFNCHLTSWWPELGTPKPKPILFPQSIADLPPGDEYAKALFEMSSELPPKFLEEAKRMKLVPQDAKSARAMAYNTDIDALVDFLVIGTRAKDTNVE
jgi:hypothetical protein